MGLAHRSKEFFCSNDGRKDAYLTFIIAVIIRLISATILRSRFGLPFKLFNLETEGFHDFKALYVPWARAFWSFKWYPYSYDNEVLVLNCYGYPPLFLYLISVFGFSFLPDEFIALPILLTDAASSALVYFIARKITGRKTAFFTSLVYALAPINVFYVGSYWLNPGPVTFFLMLSVFMLLSDRYRAALFSLTLAIMMKQVALFFVFPYFAFLLAKEGWRQTLLRGMEFVNSCLLFSLPYILLTPMDYFSHLFIFTAPTFSVSTDLPSAIAPVNIAHFLKYIGVEGLALQTVALTLNSYMLLFIAISLISSVIYIKAKNRSFNDSNFITLLTLYGFATHLFMPRGIYKFYLALLTPLLALTLILSIAGEKSLRRSLLRWLPFFVFNLSLIILPRLICPLLLMVATGYCLSQFHNSTRNSILLKDTHNEKKEPSVNGYGSYHRHNFDQPDLC